MNEKIDTDKIEIDEKVLDGKERDFHLEAWYLKGEHKGDALVEIRKSEKLIRRFLYPAYKVFNLSAHFSEIIASELSDGEYGYEVAGSDGLGGEVMPREVEIDED